MKTLYLIRHAKSSWEHIGLSDRDRPLNDRGLRDAPLMAKLLRAKGVQPDQLVSSPAKRAFSTAQFFAEAFGLKSSDILVIGKVYEALADDIIAVVREFSDNWNTVLLFGHNPTFTEVANRFTENFIANVPTCGIVRVDDPVPTWRQFGSPNVQVSEFHYPKQYFE